MKRRTLDVLFSVGGLLLAGLLLVLAVVMTSNANFSKSYVKDQLSQEKITFKTAATLTAEEKQQPCLVIARHREGEEVTVGLSELCGPIEPGQGLVLVV